jgi:GT2 family glycosyltransferase
MSNIDTDHTPTVSVVIVSWNAKQYLAQCLRTLTERVCRYSMEVLVVDNDSTDGSPAFVESSFPNIRLIRNSSNLGFAMANNIGIRKASGKYICLVNSDVEVFDECITRLVDYCDTHPEVGMVGPRIVGSDGKLQRSCRGFPGVWNMFCRAFALDVIFPKAKLFGGYLLHYWNHDTTAPVDILSGCFLLVRRESLLKVGLLDEEYFMYGEDMDWCKRFWTNGWRVVFVPAGEALHYGGASSANAPVRFFIEKQRADLQYWKKHHRWLARQCYFVIACLHHVLRVVGYAWASWTRRRHGEQQHLKLLRGIRCLRWLLSPTTILSVMRNTG